MHPYTEKDLVRVAALISRWRLIMQKSRPGTRRYRACRKEVDWLRQVWYSINDELAW